MLSKPRLGYADVDTFVSTPRGPVFKLLVLVCAKDSSGLQETLFIEKEVCLHRVEVAGR